MPNRNYERGRRMEYKVKQLYKGNGYIVVRASGSKSPFDLVALKDGEVPLLIQCKTTKQKLVAKRLKNTFVCYPPLLPSKNYTQLIHIKIDKDPKWVTEVV